MKFTGKTSDGFPQLSVVIPCLNEADTVGLCIETAQAICLRHGISHEIIVADNGSTDASIGIAKRSGARVIAVRQRGYGYALQAGISAAAGEYVLIGDADDSYDFRAIPRFFDSLEAGYEYVQGCRLPSGGGRIFPGAMPWLHRYIGNPFFSMLARRLLGVSANDVYCGLRGFTKSLYERLELRAGGMEFAIELVVQATFAEANCLNVPVTLRPDGRKAHGPHLRTFRDGFRTLVFLLKSWWNHHNPTAPPTQAELPDYAC